MLFGSTKGSLRELFVFPDPAIFTERDHWKFGCDSTVGIQGMEALLPAVAQRVPVVAPGGRVPSDWHGLCA